MAINIDVQVSTRSRSIPSVPELSNWATVALRRFRSDAEMTVRLVDRAEGTALNEHYRGQLGKTGPTNVLSFPFDPPQGLPVNSPLTRLLGDVIICAPVVTQEVNAQSKLRAEHWAHLVVHGVLHLLGYDHQDENEASEMETIERELLESCGISDPYAERVPAPDSIGPVSSTGSVGSTRARHVGVGVQ